MPAGCPDRLEASRAPIPSFFGQTTSDARPLLGGTAEASSLVLVGVGGAVFCVTATALGEWSLDTGSATPLSGRFDLGADGPKSLLITSIDSAGNSRGVAGTFVLDTTTPPAAPTLCSVQVHDGRPLLDGTAEADSTVMVGIGGARYAVQADRAGRWRLDTRETGPCSGLLDLGEDGEKRVVLVCTNAAGHTATRDTGFVLASPDRDGGAAAQPAQDLPRTAVHDARLLLSGVAGATRTVLAALGGRRGLVQQQQQRHRQRRG